MRNIPLPPKTLHQGLQSFSCLPLLKEVTPLLTQVKKGREGVGEEWAWHFWALDIDG